MSGVQLGPAHSDYGKPVGRASVATGRPRTGRPPRPAPERPPELIVMDGSVQDAIGRTRFSLTQILMAYAAEHKRNQPRGLDCHCLLCRDLRWHIDAERTRRDGGGQ